jgi:hypothetical protein
VQTFGYDEKGDGGGALYERVAVEPNHAGKFQDLGGAWFGLADQDINVKMFGAKSDGLTNATNAFLNAINYAMINQIVLDVTGDYGFVGEIVFTQTNHLRMTTKAPSYFRNRAVAHTRKFFWITQAGFDFEIKAFNYLIIDGAELRSIVLRLENDADSSPNATVWGVITTNAKLIGPSGDVNGIVVIGSYNKVDIRDTEATNITMQAGLQGRVSQGFVVARSSDIRGPKHIYMRRVAARNVTSPDYSDSGYGDIDGFALFQNEIDGGSFDVDHLTAENCARRGIKTQIISPIAIMNNVYIIRNTPSVAVIGTIDIAHQYYQCEMNNVSFEYGGNAIHQNGTTPFNISHPGPTLTPIPWGIPLASINNISIIDRGTNKVPLRYLFSLAYTGTDPNPRMFSASNVKIIGAAVNAILSLNSLGQDCVADINLSNFMVGMDSQANEAAIARGSGSLKTLNVNLTNFRNFNGEVVPLLRNYSGAINVESSYGVWSDNGGNFGVAVASGGYNSPFNGIKNTARSRGNLVNRADAIHKSYSGISTAETYYIAQGVTQSFGNYGWINNGALIIVGTNSNEPPGIYKIGRNAVITNVSANPNITTAPNNGTEPTTGAIRMWIDAATLELKFKAVNNYYYVSVYAFTG